MQFFILCYDKENINSLVIKFKDKFNDFQKGDATLWV